MEPRTNIRRRGGVYLQTRLTIAGDSTHIAPGLLLASNEFQNNPPPITAFT